MIYLAELCLSYSFVQTYQNLCSNCAPHIRTKAMMPLSASEWRRCLSACAGVTGAHFEHKFRQF